MVILEKLQKVGVKRENMTSGGRRVRNLVAIQLLGNVEPRLVADILDSFLALASEHEGQLCLLGQKLREKIKELAPTARVRSEHYKLYLDLVRLGALIPAMMRDTKSLHEVSLPEWCRKRISGKEYVCILEHEYARLREVVNTIRKRNSLLSLLSHCYTLRRNKALFSWLDQLYAYSRISIKRAYELLRNVTVEEYGDSVRDLLDKLLPEGLEMLREKLLKPLEKMSDGIIMIDNDMIVVDVGRYHETFRIKALRVYGREGARLDAVRLVRAYLDYLRKRGWLSDWIRWGGHSVNLYELWREYFHDVPWDKFLSRVRELVSSTLGMEYTYYFIYPLEKAHSINIRVEAAKAILGDKLGKLITPHS